MALIHRDRKKPWESSSGFGQVVSLRGPRDLTTGDIDHYARKWLKDRTLLRLIEHTWPDAPDKIQQRRTLADISAIVRHAVHCPNAPLALDDRSGVFLLAGEIAGGSAPTLGPHELFSVKDDGGIARVTTLATQEDVFDWLEGSRGGKRRSRAA